MSLWRRLFSKPKEEAQISLSEAFPLTETDGLSEVEIDEAVLEARSEPDEGVDEESMPEPLPPIVEDELASVAGPSTDETEDLQSLESQSIPQGPSIEMPKSSGSRPMPNLGSIRKGKNPSTSQVLSSQDVGQGAPIDSESDDVLSELPDSHDHLELSLIHI